MLGPVLAFGGGLVVGVVSVLGAMSMSFDDAETTPAKPRRRGNRKAKRKVPVK